MRAVGEIVPGRIPVTFARNAYSVALRYDIFGIQHTQV